MAELRIDPVVEARRQAYIDRLYELSGRTCSTYTGLMQERIRQLIEQDMAQVLEGQ